MTTLCQSIAVSDSENEIGKVLCRSSFGPPWERHLYSFVRPVTRAGIDRTCASLDSGKDVVRLGGAMRVSIVLLHRTCRWPRRVDNQEEFLIRCFAGKRDNGCVGGLPRSLIRERKSQRSRSAIRQRRTTCLHRAVFSFSETLRRMQSQEPVPQSGDAIT